MKNYLIAIFSLASILTFGQPQFSVLLFTKTEGFHHVSIHEGITAIKAIAAQNQFNCDWTQDAKFFNKEKLEKYNAVIFLNTTGDVLNNEQQAAMEQFIKSGKGFVGIHSASDTEYDWEWYTKLVGRMFVRHPRQQTAYMKILNKRFPGTQTFNDYQLWTDEWYEFTPEKGQELNYLISVDETTYEAKISKGNEVTSEGMGKNHPVAWYQNYDGGRSFYTGLGHLASSFEDPRMRQHLFGGIFWAATGKGMIKADNK
jgi:uncharacterized protein